MNNRLRWLLLTLIFSLGGCAGVAVQDYSERQPAIQLEAFFDGKLTAHGVIKDRSGRVIRTFNADIDASWDRNVGTLDERFVFDDGERQQRIWRLSPQADGTYLGTAGDVQGAGRLQLSGNSVFLDYVLSVPYGDGTINVRVDDRMYQVAPGILINESIMSKFGFRVGSILLVIIQDGAVDRYIGLP